MTVEERARRLLDSLGPLEYTKEATARRWVKAALRAATEESRTAALEEAAKICADCAAAMDIENPREELCRGAYECAERKIRALKDSK